MTQLIHEFRIEADSLSKQIKALKPSAEITKANNSIVMAKCWFGKLLGQLGEETPYKNDGHRTTLEDIEAVADNSNPKILAEENQIKSVDWVRERVQVLIRDFKSLTVDSSPETLAPLVILVAIEQHLHECRFWLGLALGAIRDANKG